MVERRGLQLLRSGNVNIHFIFIGLKGQECNSKVQTSPAPETTDKI